MSCSTGAGSVDLRGITKRYGETVAIDDLSLAVSTGEFVTLLGPSGCGKTTTLRMIGGFERPDADDVLIGGVSMAGRPAHLRPVNTAFQNYALFPHMTVGQNVAFGLEMAAVPRQERRRRVADSLAMVRLPDIADRAPGELSGGQQQRVALARALVNRPAVLLLDEPLGALDLSLRRKMQDELRTLNRETGATFIYVTHDQDEALTMSDRVAVMREGRITQIGPPAEIYERPRSRFVPDFVGTTNLLDGTFQELRGGIATVSVADVGMVFATMVEGIAPPPGTAVSIAVRPENVRIGTNGADPGPVTTVTGRLLEMRFGGAHSQIVVELAGGLRLLSHTPADGGDLPAVTGGSPVTLSFRAANASVLID